MNANYSKALERFHELERLVELISNDIKVKTGNQNTFNLRELNAHLLFKNKPPTATKA